MNQNTKEIVLLLMEQKKVIARFNSDMQSILEKMVQAIDDTDPVQDELVREAIGNWKNDTTPRMKQ